MTTMRLILIGKTGNGKSATGNKIMGQTVFQPSCGWSSVTDKCSWKKGSFGTLTLQVTDTPGVCDTHKSEGEVEREIAKCVATMTPGPDAILFVVRGKERFTEEEFSAFERLKVIFGQEMTKYMILVLPRITQEEFEEYKEKSQKSIPPKLIRLLHEAGNRCVCFGDDSKYNPHSEQERETLVRRVLSLKTQNNGTFYSNDFVKKFDDEIKKKAQITGTHVDNIKENIVEEKDELFLSGLNKTIPISKELTSNSWCLVM